MSKGNAVGNELPTAFKTEQPLRLAQMAYVDMVRMELGDPVISL